MTKIRKLGHVVLFVRDPMSSADWYCDVLGMETVVLDNGIPAVFLSCGTRDHDLALFHVPDSRDLGHRDIEHVAFEFDGDLNDFKRFHSTLVDKGIQILDVVDHGISYGIYFLDPDGHHLEVFYQRIANDAESKTEMARIGTAKADPIDLENVRDSLDRLP